MAVKIELKRSAVPGKIPTTSSLELGELAVNTYDGKVYLKQDVSGTESIVELASTSGSILSASYADNAGHANTATSSSYALIATSSSYASNATSASHALNANNAISASYALNTTSASYAQTSSYAGDFTVAGTLTAQKLVVQTISSSIIYSSGSNIFGDELSDTQTFTGSVNITGSLSINGENFTNTSASFNTRILNNSSSINILSGSYLNSSASFDTRILNNSSSINILSSSFLAFSGSYNTGSFTGSFIGSFSGSLEGTASFAATASNILGGNATYIPYFDTDTTLANSAIYQVGTGSIAINETNITTANPEALYVFQTHPTSFNVVTGKGNLNNYLQLNIQNTNQGTSASSDIVATANNGNEENMYVNMGINNENFTGPLGSGNDAYVYSVANNFHIGSAATGSQHLGFFVGGFDVNENNKITLKSNNLHEVTGSLNISGSVIVLNGITGSLFGTASYAITSSYAMNADFLDGYDSKAFLLTSSYNAFTASYLIDSASFSSSINLLSGSYLASSASFNTRILNNSSSINTLSGSYLNSSSSFDSRILNNSSSIDTLSGSYLASSSSFNNRILNNSSSIGILSSSFLAFSSSYTTGSFTGSFKGDGSGLYNISASGIIGLNLSQIASGSVTASIDPNLGFRVNTNTTISGSTLISGSLTVTGSTNLYGATGTVLSANVDTLIFTGSIYSSGSTILSGNLNVTNGITGSLFGTSSWANNATTSSYALVATSASYSLIATSASHALNANNAISASHALNTNNAVSASYALIATSASYALNTTSASYAETSSFANDFTVAGTLTAQKLVVQTISSSVIYSSGSNEFGNDLSNTQTFTGSVNITGSLNVNGRDYISDSSSFDNRILNNSSSIDLLSGSYLASSASFDTRILNNSSSIDLLSGSYLNSSASFDSRILSNSSSIDTLSSSYIASSSSFDSRILDNSASIDLLSGSYLNSSASFNDRISVISGSYATTGSNIFLGNQTITGSLIITGSTVQIGNNDLIGNTSLSGSINVSGSQTFIGDQSLTGSFLITGSTLQVGNNTLLGDTLLTGSITISGSYPVGSYSSSVNIIGDTTMTGYLKFNPQSTNIDTSLSASYIFVSGSTNDLYFSQNGNGYSNVTRLRWIEGNLYTGLLHGGLISATTGSTTFNLSSGSGIVVSLNASITNDPYPSVQYVNWGNFTSQPLTFLTSSIQTYIGIDSSGQITQQTSAFNDGTYNQIITIGTVLHQNKSTVNASITYPNVAYGYKQRTYDFVKAFGPLKLSGLNIIPSSSLGLEVSSGTAFADGRNYQVDPNNPSYITDPGTTVSKIFRYYQSGSEFVQDTNGGVGYNVIDPLNYNPAGSGSLTLVPGTGVNREWSIQRIFWYPNSATKGIVVYYGTKTYTTSTAAAANISYEQFQEVENTKQNAVYLGAIALRNDATFTDSTSYVILPGGIFRNVGGSGGGGNITSLLLSQLGDVTITGPTNNQPLVYDLATTKWVNKSFISASLQGNASTATTASYALIATSSSYALNSTSASYALNTTSASYALNSTSASHAINANNAISASYALNTTSASYAVLSTSASHAINADNATNANNAISASHAVNADNSTSASYANNATSASYANNATSASYAVNADNSTSASYANNATSASYAINTTSASYAQNATSASYANNATSASYALNSDNAISASYAQTSSYAQNATSSSYSDNAISASHALNADNTISASYALNATSASYAFNATSASHAINADNAISASNAISSSYALNADNTISASYAFNATTSSYALVATSASYALNADNTVSASYALNSNSSSYANNATSASYAVNTDNALNANNATSASYSLTSTSSSYAINATSASYAQTASYADTFIVGGDITGSNALFTGTVTAQKLNVQTVSSSVIFSSGSNVFGNNLSNTQVMTGSVSITGSLNINGVSATLGTGTTNKLPKFINSNTVSDSILFENGSNIQLDVTAANGGLDLMFGGSPFARFGIINPGIPGNPGVDNDAYIGSTINNDFVVRINNTEAARFDTLLRLKIANIQNAITDTNQFLVSDSGVVKYRTGDELLSDIGAASSSSLNNYLPLTGGSITGSVNITGSLSVNDSSVILSNQTSSMSVLSASYAENTTSSSYALNATSASYTLNSDNAISASYAVTSLSASYASTSSYSNNFKINTTLDFAGTLTDYATVNSSVSGLNNLFTQPTGSFTSAFFKYTVSNGTNTRAGEVIAVWNSSATEYTDFSTVDLGTTNAVTSSVSLVSGEIQFNIQTNSSGWKIKSIGTFI